MMVLNSYISDVGAAVFKNPKHQVICRFYGYVMAIVICLQTVKLMVQVSLSYDNSTKLATNSGGVTVTGTAIHWWSFFCR